MYFSWLFDLMITNRTSANDFFFSPFFLLDVDFLFPLERSWYTSVFVQFPMPHDSITLRLVLVFIPTIETSAL